MITSILENLVKTYSFCYKDSCAFRRALEFVKSNDQELYEELIRKEAEECGAI